LEDAWARAPAIGPLLQSEPQEGLAATERTKVRILLDGVQGCFGLRTARLFTEDVEANVKTRT
jgi:hypothetical protein